MEKGRTLKRIGSLILTLAMILTVSRAALPVYAEGGTISIKYYPSIELTESTNFELYKVGSFGHDENGMTVINLADGFAGSNVDLNIAVPEEESDQKEGSDWHKSWLKAASDLENWIKTPSEDKKIPGPVWSDKISRSESYQQIGGALENGIYLLIGDEQRVGDKYWAPVPVLIMVLNGETKFDLVNTELKMSGRPVVYKHTVVKSWDDKGHEAARPESVDVNIFYGETQMDTVTLSSDNNWTYTWYSQEADRRIYTNIDPDAEDGTGIETSELNEKNDYTIKLPEESGVWRVDEVSKADNRYYSATVAYDSRAEDSSEEASADRALQETMMLTNTFRTAELTITKNLENYLNQADANAVVVFEITGLFDGEEVYKNSVGMTFKGPGTQTAKLTNIPYNLDSLTVEEVYSVNYKVDGEKLQSLTAVIDNETKAKTYTAEFTNKFSEDKPIYASGVVNTYGSDGTYTPRSDTSGLYTKADEQ